MLFQYGSQKKCRGRDNSQIGQGGHGVKSLRTPDVDYVTSFTCPERKDNPKVLIDGITMGTIKELPENQNQPDEYDKN